MNDVFWPMVIMALGLLLMSLELFVPSGGLLGVGAFVCLGISLWTAFQASQQVGMLFVLLELIIVPTTGILAFSVWTRSPMGRRMTLAPPLLDEVDVSHAGRRLEDLIGWEGRAISPLHPCGHVELQGRRHDGLAESGLIAEGAKVRVVQVRSGQLVVRPVVAPAADPSDSSNAPRVDHGAEA